MLRKSQGLNCWHSDLPFSRCLPRSCLPTALFQSCLSSLQRRLGGLRPLVLLTLGEVAWALVHQDWFLHICKVPYSSQTPPPVVKPQVLTVDHEGNYSLPPARPDSSARHLMLARAGELRKGSPAKQPWARHTRVKVTLTCMHKGS